MSGLSAMVKIGKRVSTTLAKQDVKKIDKLAEQTAIKFAEGTTKEGKIQKMTDAIMKNKFTAAITLAQLGDAGYSILEEYNQVQPIVEGSNPDALKQKADVIANRGENKLTENEVKDALKGTVDGDDADFLVVYQKHIANRQKILRAGQILGGLDRLAVLREVLEIEASDFNTALMMKDPR